MDELVRIFGLEALGQYVTGQEYVRWAESYLKAGHDSSGLRVLAGLDLPILADLREIQERFHRTLSELKINTPDRQMALDNFANEIILDIEKKQIDPKEAVDLLSQVNGAFRGSQDRYSGWGHLRSVISGYDGELSQDELSAVVSEELQLFRSFSAITLPDQFRDMVFCDRCRYFGLPTHARVHYRWLPAPIYRLIFHRQPFNATVCPQCQNYRLVMAYQQEGRREFLRRQGSVANKGMQRTPLVGKSFDSK